MIPRSNAKEKSLSSLIKQADIAFGSYIKARDTKDGVIRCFICGNVVPRNQCQAMHYVDRDQMAVRYDEINVHAGCKPCNMYDTFHKTNYIDAMMNVYPAEQIFELLDRSRSLAKFTRYEIGEIIDTYKDKLKQLR